MKRDVIVGKLIAEGLSEKTLVKLNDRQLAGLAERMLSEQVKKGSVVMSKVTSNPNDVKKLTDQGLNVELREKKKEVEVEEQTTKLGSTPGLGDNEGSTELDNVTVTASKLQKSPNVKSNQVNPNLNTKTSQSGGQKVGRLKTFANDMKSSLSGLPNSLKPIGAIPAAVVNAIGGQVGFKGRSEDQKMRGDLNRDSQPKDVKENNFGKRVTKGHNNIPEFMDSKKLKESQIKKWIKGLVENEKFHSFTSKNEIMELIQVKVNENKGQPSKPDTDAPVREKPTTKPGKPKRENPFEPKHAPKPKALGEDENKMPEFMKFKNLGFKFKDQN